MCCALFSVRAKFDISVNRNVRFVRLSHQVATYFTTNSCSMYIVIRSSPGVQYISIPTPYRPKCWQIANMNILRHVQCMVINCFFNYNLLFVCYIYITPVDNLPLGARKPQRFTNIYNEQYNLIINTGSKNTIPSANKSYFISHIQFINIQFYTVNNERNN